MWEGPVGGVLSSVTALVRGSQVLRATTRIPDLGGESPPGLILVVPSRLVLGYLFSERKGYPTEQLPIPR